MDPSLDISLWIQKRRISWVYQPFRKIQSFVALPSFPAVKVNRMPLDSKGELVLFDAEALPLVLACYSLQEAIEISPR